MDGSFPEEAPHQLAIQKAIPLVGTELQSLRFNFQALAEQLERRATEAEAASREMLETIEGFVNGEFTMHPTPRKTRMVMGLTNRREKSPISLPLPFYLPPVTPLAGPAPPAPSVLQAFAETDQVPKYRLSRSISTLPDLWREWTIGVKGSPSIEELDRQYGTKWRPDHKENQYYCKRMVIVRELRRRAEAMAGGYAANVDAVVKQMEVERRQSGLTLNQVVKRLKAEEKANTPGTRRREEEEKDDE